MKTNKKISKRLKTQILIQGLLLVSALTFAGIAQADFSAPRDGRPLLCDDRGHAPVQGTGEDVHEWAKKYCADLNTAHDISNTCNEVIDQCAVKIEDYFWFLLKEKYNDVNECRAHGKLIFRCTPCTYKRVIEELNDDLAPNAKADVDQACHCGNGTIDSGEDCDPQATSALPRNLQCTSQCTLVQVDPVPPSPSGETPDSGSTTADTNGGQNPSAPGVAQEILPTGNSVFKLGAVSPTVGGCSLSTSHGASFNRIGAVFLLPLLIMGMIRTRKNN